MARSVPLRLFGRICVYVRGPIADQSRVVERRKNAVSCLDTTKLQIRVRVDFRFARSIRRGWTRDGNAEETREAEQPDRFSMCMYIRTNERDNRDSNSSNCSNDPCLSSRLKRELDSRASFSSHRDSRRWARGKMVAALRRNIEPR